MQVIYMVFKTAGDALVVAGGFVVKIFWSHSLDKLDLSDLPDINEWGKMDQKEGRQYVGTQVLNLEDAYGDDDEQPDD